MPDLSKAIHDELRALAASLMVDERVGHTLQPTALVHEAYLRLAKQRNLDWSNRAQFFSQASLMMARILKDYAKARKAVKRGGGRGGLHLTLSEDATPVPGRVQFDPLVISDALEALAAYDPLLAEIAAGRLFSPLTIEEIADHMGLSRNTVTKHWRFARAKLNASLANA